LRFRAATRSTLIGVALPFFFPVLPILPVFPVLSLHAQTIPASGRVLKPDSTSAAGVRVVLHRLGRAVQGPLDSTTTDHRGRFRFSFRPDTGSLYLLSGRYAGIEYFSPPVHTNPDRPDTAIRIIVHDTSSTIPISLEARHLVVTRPGEDGTRGVLDLIVLRNDGRLTRVAPDSLQPSWSGVLPRGTIGLELGQGDFSPDAIRRRNDSLILTAPIPPGEKQITVEYLIPADREGLELLFPESVSGVNLLAEEKGVRMSGATLAYAGSQTIQGRSFRRWTGTVPAGTTIRAVFPGARRAARWILAALVALVVLGLAGGWLLLARRRYPLPASPEELIGAIAMLDARYLERENDTPAAEWNAYQSERATLKARLEAALAAGRPSR
jgi:hypothetical protein